MTERERLIELLEKAEEKAEAYLRENDYTYRIPTLKEICGVYADHLLANGVIVPPCKVGDTVYCIEHTTIRKGVVKQVKSLQDGTDTKFFVQVECEIENPFYSDKRKTKHGIYAVWEIIWGGWHRAFPTRGGAEAALKERGRQ